MPTRQASAIQARLDRHQRRRDQGVPTVSVLAGPTGLALGVWRQWLAVQGRTVALSTDPSLYRNVCRWTSQLCKDRNLAEDAVRFVASQLGLSGDEFHRSFVRKTPHEQEVFFRQVFPGNVRPSVAAVCRWFLERLGKALIEPEALVHYLDAALADDPQPWARVVAGLSAFVPVGQTPTLLLAAHKAMPNPIGWIAVAAQTLIQLATADRRLPVALAVEVNDLKRFHQQPTSESHTKAILRETVLCLEGPADTEVGQRLREMQVRDSEQLSCSIRRLAADGATEELVELFGKAAREADSSAATTNLPQDAARSAAERFLFERLEALAETAGLFELNGQILAAFGAKQHLEVDLLATKLRLAIEIDGYYHFQNRDMYRRDRRKDLQLQKSDFLVLRFLADDVVTRLEDILDTILASVVFQRDRISHQERDT